MPSSFELPVPNLFLASLPEDDLAALRPHFEKVRLTLGLGRAVQFYTTPPPQEARFQHRWSQRLKSSKYLSRIRFYWHTFWAAVYQ